jgi:hypothetical protein
MLTSGFLGVRCRMACNWPFRTCLSCLVHRAADEYGFTPRLSINFSKIYHVKFVLKILFQLEEFGFAFTYDKEIIYVLTRINSFLFLHT